MSARPSGRLIALLLVGVLPAALAGRWPGLGALAIGLDLMVLGLFAIDLRAARSADGARVRRSLPARVLRGRPFELSLEVTNPAARSISVLLTERLPEGVAPRDGSFSLVVPGGGRASRSRSVVAARRGSYRILAPAGERASPFGLARLPLQSSDGASELSVLPGLAPTGRHEALLRQRRLRELGIRSARERGAGTEIAGLRLHVPGDPFNGIDWKATARRGVPVSRERQTERRQDVLLLVDAGRRMARETETQPGEFQSRLDQAIDAALLLGQVALQGDDRVGLIAFQDEIVRAVAPLRGAAQAGQLAVALGSLEPLLREPPYGAIAAAVAARFPRRCLVVLLTDIAEPASARSLVKAVSLLARRHLVLCAVFRDPSLAAARSSPPADGEALFRAGAAAVLAEERERGIGELRRAGALLLEADGASLPTELVNRYLEIKARRLL